MTHKINSAGTAAINTDTRWIPISEDTPRGVKLQLINRTYGVALYAKWEPSDTFFSHYYPLPTFDKDEK